MGLAFSSNGSREFAAMQPRNSATWSACAACVGPTWRANTCASLNEKIDGPSAHELRDTATIAWPYMTHRSAAK